MLGVAAGASFGVGRSKSVKMTDIPQPVSLFNAVGGGAAASIALADIVHYGSGSTLSLTVSIPIILDVLIGSVTVSGSVIAAGKLQGVIPGQPIVFPGARVLNVAVTAIAGVAGLLHQVLIVPGYGLAAAQAQHEVAELAKLFTDHGVNVRNALHPVASRMPGQMNVLLAEADVPYTQMLQLEEANTAFNTCDVALVIGADDVCNPDAPKIGMFFADAKQALREILIVKGITIIGSIVGTRQDLTEVFALHAAGKTALVRESNIEDVNDAMADVLSGKVPARLVFEF